MRRYLLLVMIMLVGPLSAQTLRKVPSEYSTIQAAVNAATDLDTIAIASGEYAEIDSLVGKRLVMTGAKDSPGTVIMGPGNGIWLYRGSLEIYNISFKNCTQGIYVLGHYDGTAAKIFNCTFDHNGVAVNSYFTDDVIISNSLFTNNTVAYRHDYYGQNGFICNSTFYGNTTDIDFFPNYATAIALELRNCIFTSTLQARDDGYGDKSSIDMSYCCYDPSKIGSNVKLLDGNISAPPLFINAPSEDFRLQAGSPCINAGDPNSLFNDADNTRNDIGYTGGNKLFMIGTNRADMGTTKIGRNTTFQVTIQNYSNKPVTVNSFETDNADLSATTRFPIVIPIGSGCPVNITQSPTALGRQISTIRLHSNDLCGATFADVTTSVYGINYTGRTITVPSNAPTIQSAIDASIDSDTVLVSPGTYQEHLVISTNKSLAIVGSNGFAQTILTGDNTQELIDVAAADKFMIKGFTLKNGTAAIRSNKPLRIYDCYFYNNNQHGIDASMGADLWMYNCVFELNRIGIYQGMHWGMGPSFIYNSTFVNNATDIQRNDIRDNTSKMNVYNSILVDQVANESTNSLIHLYYCNYHSDRIGSNISFVQGNQPDTPILFKDSLNSDFRLSSLSPCINAGSPDTSGLTLPENDLDMNRRIFQGRIDVGAFEYGSMPLPVELTSFEASIAKSSVILSWKTAGEVNNFGFEVERKSTNNWCKVGFVEGHGTTSAPQAYSYTDHSASGKVSYRLRQIDRDGKIEYSKEVDVTAASVPSVFALEQNYPNPFNPSTVIGYSIPSASHVVLKVYDLLGREVETLVNEQMEPGIYTAEFKGSRLSSGVYFYRLDVGGWSDVKRLTLTK